MLLVDANVLLYAINRDAPQHRACREWLATSLGGRTRVAFAWTVLLGFLRVSTRAGLFARPLSPAEAFDLIDAWLSAPASAVVTPAERHPALLRDLVLGLGIGGNLASDPHPPPSPSSTEGASCRAITTSAGSPACA